MKKLIFCFLLISLSSFASECPDLAGTYHCSFSDNRYSPLKIEQSHSPSPDQERVTYRFTYTAFSNSGEEFSATPTGEPDGQGWITKCSKNTLRSIPTDASMMSEIFLDKNDAFIRRLNGSVIQKCPRKTVDLRVD